jgi:hypothetical protein
MIVMVDSKVVSELGDSSRQDCYLYLSRPGVTGMRLILTYDVSLYGTIQNLTCLLLIYLIMQSPTIPE